MSSSLYAFGRLAHRRWRAVLLIWLLVVVVAGGAAALLSQGTTTSLSIPGTESQAALDRLDATFPQVSGSSVQLVGVATDGAVDDPAVLHAVAGLVDDLEELDEVSAVASPLAEDGSLRPDASEQVSADGDTLLLTAQLDVGRDAVTPDLTDAVLDLAEANGTPAVTWTAGGDAFGAGTPTLGATELVGLGVAAVVLTLTLGSLLAAGMPILTALVRVGTAMAVVFAATAVVDCRAPPRCSP